MQIKGIRVDSLSITREETGPGFKFEVGYSLMSDKDTVLAKQTCNGYQGSIKLDVSADSAKAIRNVSDILKKEIETILGFDL